MADEPQNTEVMVKLATIETKLDMFMKITQDQEKRLRTLERRDAYVLVLCSGVAMVSPIISKKVFGL